MVFFYLVAPTTMDKSTMSVLIVVIVSSLLFFMFSKENEPSLKGQFFKNSSFFLLGYCIVHFQYYFDYVLGNATLSNSYIWINTSVVVKAMVLSIIGMLCFFMGYFTFKNTLKNTLKKNNEKQTGVQLLLILALISLVVFLLTVNPLYLAGQYGAEDMGISATYAILIFSLLVYAIIIQNCRNMIVSGYIPSNFKEYAKLQGYFLISLIGIYLLLVMLSGDRGPIITFGICFVSGYFIVTKRKLNIKYGIPFILAGAFFMTLLGEIRKSDKDLGFSSKFKEVINQDNIYNEPSFIPQTQELAGSVRTLHATLDYIPEKHDFLYGRFQFQQISVVIPFFNFFLQSIFKDHHAKYAGSSSFVTWINQGDFPTSGDGTSCIVDFYFDFGLMGVIIGMFFFGYFTRFLEINMFSYYIIPSVIVHVLGVVYLSNAIYISRSSVLFDMRSVIWIFAVLFINKKFIANK
jgi:oligosaccharide repeat unit polymerase